MARKTPLYDVHRALGARLVDFAGWEMPVQYTSVIAEHEAVRSAAGLFDVSHMGEVEFRGPGALASANALITNDLGRIADGQAVYAGLLNEAGGFVDDVVAYRFSTERILVCVNASNRAKDFAWMSEHARGVKPIDRGDDYAQLALQGPKAAAILQRLTPLQLQGIGTYHFAEGAVASVGCVVSRTGYTGEDGFELYCPPDRAVALWNALLEAGAQDGLRPAGLGARDTLRTEMKYALYGNDIDDVHTPSGGGPRLDCEVGQGGLRRPHRARAAEAGRHPAQAGGLRDAGAGHSAARLRAARRRRGRRSRHLGHHGPQREESHRHRLPSHCAGARGCAARC